MDIPRDAVLIRKATWREEDGRVVIERRAPTVRGPRDVIGWVHWAWHPKRIRLDDMGSFVWLHAEPGASLGTIVDAVSAEFPDRADDVGRRVTRFAAALAALDLLRIDDDHRM